MQDLSILVKTPIALPILSIKKILLTIKTWQERSITRHRLTKLPKYRLEDMGISPQEAIVESQKPFWEE